MTNPRAQAQSTVSPIRRVREKLKRFFGPWGMFVKGFIKHPVMVGSIVPSSPTLIRHMLRPVDWKNTKLFVEYGPGVGTFCRPVLERMAGDATLIAIDTNPDFIDYLRKDIRDSRFIAVHGSAADVEEIVRAHGFEQADYVLSGLPFSTLPAGVGPAIAAATHRVLRPGGAFLVYQFRARARDFLAAHFRRIDILVINAAFLPQLTPVTQVEPKQLGQALTVNVLATQALLAAFDPLLKRAEHARVIGLTSSVGTAPRAYWGAYGASKAAFEVLLDCYASEIEKLGDIRVAIVDPGATRTAMRARAYPGEDPASVKAPETVADRIVTLVQDDFPTRHRERIGSIG